MAKAGGSGGRPAGGFGVGVRIQPRGRPEFSSRVVGYEGGNYRVVSTTARPGTYAHGREFVIPANQAERATR